MPNLPLPGRRCILGAAGALLCSPLAALAQAPLHSIAVLPLDLVDDHENPLTVAAQTRRLQKAYGQLQQELAARNLYRVVDFAPAQALLERLLAQQEFMYRCSDCAVQIGKLLGTELAMTSWVQKVSELILNFNVEIYDVASERSLLSKSVDMRGNDDVSWERGVRFLIRDMAEKRERNPHYGLV